MATEEDPLPKPVETPQEQPVPAEVLFGGLQPGVQGSYHTLSPEAMRILWSPQIAPPPV